MAWYKQPIQPIDPIVKDPSGVQPEQQIRYLRDNFEGNGQDSNTEPTAQDPAQWQALTNIQPISQGVLSRRWGYQQLVTFGAGLSEIRRMYSLENNITLNRQLVYCLAGSVWTSSELGPGATPVLTNNFGVDRMVDSRNYAYFYTGEADDLKKWDGTLGGGVTNWGIAPPADSNISVTTVGPSPGGTVVQGSGAGAGWTNPSNAVSPTLFATTTVTAGSVSKTLSITNFGFAVPGTSVIRNISVTLNAGSSVSTTTLTAQFLKAGVPYAKPSNNAVFDGAPVNRSVLAFFLPPPFQVGSGGSFLPADVNASNFGVQLYITQSPGINASVSLNDVAITIGYTTASSAIIDTPAGAGNVNLTVGRVYYCVYENSSTGHYSDLNDASLSSGPVTNQVIDLSAIPVSQDPQVDTKIILATADGGDPSILYELVSLPNATTTYVDNTPETVLLLNQQFLFTDPYGNEFGVTFNDPPPNGTICIKHKGRLWMAQEQNLFFSKAVAELTLPNGFIAGKYEESWPPQNYFDISAGAETIQGLFSDGNVIYIGTQSHIRRIFGDSPANFQQPEICHQDVGVLNQETWVNVYLEGTPTGFMWLTPDYKVMGSDGNTYLDIGHPIQDVLNSINPNSILPPHAMFVQQGPYDLYILGIPTGTSPYCDTHCVFNMRSQQWIIWKPTDASTSMLFNVTATGQQQWLFATIEPGVEELVYQYISTATSDRVGNPNGPVDFTATALTSWMHLGSPTTRKVLDELEVIGVPEMLVSINGASTQPDFELLTPISIVSNTRLVLSPFQTFKVYLSGKTSRYHYYQIQFQSFSLASNPILLNSYALRANPWNTL